MSHRPVRLSTGRTVFHRANGSGATEAYFADNSEMTESEWQEYAKRMKTRSARRLKPKDPFHRKGYSQYGAQMGRQSDSADLFGRVRLTRVPIDSGGYDPGGAYWGTGETLWYAVDKDGNEKYFRAPYRDAAKRKLLADHPYPDEIKFYK